MRRHLVAGARLAEAFDGENPIRFGDPLPTHRDAGFSDRDIWDIASTASFFNMTNRMASAVDMRPNPEYAGQYR